MAARPGSWRETCAGLVRHAIDKMSVPVEPALVHAVWRWGSLRARAIDSARTYLAGWTLWALWSGRTSLGRQLSAPQEAITDYLEALLDTYCDRTVRTRLAALRSWYGWLEDEDLVVRSPIRRTATRMARVDEGRVQKADGTRQALSQAEAERVATWCLRTQRPEMGAAVLLMTIEGLRRAEVAGLVMRGYHRPSEDAPPRMVVHGKGRRTRAVELESVTVMAIERYLDRHRRRGERGPLLRRPGGGHYSPATIGRWAKCAARVIGRDDDISSHDLRKTCATLLAEQGNDLAAIARKLGHSAVELTSRCYVARNVPLRPTGIGGVDHG